ncbi:MAG: hypothetical protein R3Y68_07710 [Rikenellaceae bacterium]
MAEVTASTTYASSPTFATTGSNTSYAELTPSSAYTEGTDYTIGYSLPSGTDSYLSLADSNVRSIDGTPKYVLFDIDAYATAGLLTSSDTSVSFDVTIETYVNGDFYDTQTVSVTFAVPTFATYFASLNEQFVTYIATGTIDYDWGLGDDSVDAAYDLMFNSTNYSILQEYMKYATWSNYSSSNYSYLSYDGTTVTYDGTYIGESNPHDTTGLIFKFVINGVTFKTSSLGITVSNPIKLDKTITVAKGSSTDYIGYGTNANSFDIDFTEKTIEVDGSTYDLTTSEYSDNTTLWDSASNTLTLYLCTTSGTLGSAYQNGYNYGATATFTETSVASLATQTITTDVTFTNISNMYNTNNSSIGTSPADTYLGMAYSSVNDYVYTFYSNGKPDNDATYTMSVAYKDGSTFNVKFVGIGSSRMPNMIPSSAK